MALLLACCDTKGYRTHEMVRITVTAAESRSQKRRASIESLSVTDISSGDLQEGQDLDFKRLVDLDDHKAKQRLLDDVVAFLNRGPARILVGIEEKGGRFDSFRPLAGDADKFALRVQTLIQDSVSPVPADVQVVPLHLDDGFLIDIQIPRHSGGPFMNRLAGTYLIRSGARNLPIDPGMLRSRFIDETSWMHRLDELTAAEDTAIAAERRLEQDRALRVAILPREHFTCGLHSRRTIMSADRRPVFLRMAANGSRPARTAMRPSQSICARRALSASLYGTTGSSTRISPMRFASSRAKGGWPFMSLKRKPEPIWRT